MARTEKHEKNLARVQSMLDDTYEGKIQVGDIAVCNVNPLRRQDTARNHTATHMLHAALREILGTHVRQAGSLVAPDRLRFDFSHISSLTKEEILKTQNLINQKIRQNIKVQKTEDSYASAIEKGAIAWTRKRNCVTCHTIKRRLTVEQSLFLVISMNLMLD